MHEKVVYNNTYVYPGWGYAIGYCMAALSMVQIPLYAAVKMLLQKGTLKEVRLWAIFSNKTIWQLLVYHYILRCKAIAARSLFRIGVLD